MVTRIKISALAAVCAFGALVGPALPLRGAEAKFPFAVYSVNDGLVQSVIYAIRQDHLGYLWLGTQAGVSRFDGRDFVNYDTRDGLAHNEVRDILVTRSGAVLFGTVAGLCRYNGKGIEVYGDPASQPRRVRCLAESPDGAVWGGSEERGVFRLKDGRFEYFGAAQGLPADRARAVLVDGSGRVWVGWHGGGLGVYEDGAWTRFDPAEHGYNPRVRALYQDEGGGVVVGTDRGVYLVKDGRVAPFLNRANLRAQAVNAIAPDGDGGLMFATQRSGAICWRKDGFEYLTRSEGLPGNAILSLLRDHEGFLWFGTQGGGLARLGRVRLLSYTAQRGFPQDNVSAVFEDAEGHIWLGSNGGGVSQLAGRVFTSYTSATGLVDDRVLCVFEDRDGVMWFGTIGGATRMEDGRFFPFTRAQGLPHDSVYDIAQTGDGRVWFATPAGAAAYDGERFEIVDEDAGLPARQTLSLLNASDGSLWIGAAAGVAVYRDGGVVRSYTREDGMIGDFVNHMTEDGRGRVWVATDRGLAVFDQGAVKSYGVADGLSSPICNAVTVDGQDVLWVGASNGLNRFNGQGFTLFTNRDGLPANEINRGAGLRTRDGQLWFGSIAGAATFRPSEPGPPLPAPRLHISDFRVLGENRTMAQGLRLGHRENYIEIEFHGVSLGDAGNLSYSFKLEGADKQWTQSASNLAVYNKLPPGEYRFLARARNSAGAWSEQADVSFAIVPPFWRRPWFPVSLLLLAALSIALRFRAVNQRAARLETEVGKRTVELKQKNLELERLALEDQLTGARNRHFLSLFMPVELSRLKRYYFDSARGSYRSSASLGVALLDLDHFKQVNDRHGHDAGDRALVWLAGELKRFIRETDTIVRWGGEEFLIVFQDISFNDLLDLCERLRAHLAEQDIVLSPDLRIELTASIGFSVFPLDRDPAEYDWKKVVKLADAALYEAKVGGRNRVVGFNAKSVSLSEVFDMMDDRPGELADALKPGFFTVEARS